MPMIFLNLQLGCEGLRPLEMRKVIGNDGQKSCYR